MTDAGKHLEAGIYFLYIHAVQGCFTCVFVCVCVLELNKTTHLYSACSVVVVAVLTKTGCMKL